MLLILGEHFLGRLPLFRRFHGRASFGIPCQVMSFVKVLKLLGHLLSLEEYGVYRKDVLDSLWNGS